VNAYEAVVKSHSDLVWRICRMFQPMAGIIKQLAKLDLNDLGIDSKVSP